MTEGLETADRSELSFNARGAISGLSYSEILNDISGEPENAAIALEKQVDSPQESSLKVAGVALGVLAIACVSRYAFSKIASTSRTGLAANLGKNAACDRALGEKALALVAEAREDYAGKMIRLWQRTPEFYRRSPGHFVQRVELMESSYQHALPGLSSKAELDYLNNSLKTLRFKFMENAGIGKRLSADFLH